MLKTIQNEKIALTVDTLGAQMMSIRATDGTEYLWQGDPKYWGDRAPVLFPFIGRLKDKQYSLHGKTYSLGIHGFAKVSEFRCAAESDDRLVLELPSDDRTRAAYPFDFLFTVEYALKESQIEITYRVRNNGSETMPFALGGHPGFRVPLTEGECFEDYALVFSEPCEPDRIDFTENVLLSGQSERFPLQNGQRIALDHSLFDEDAIILKNVCREVTLQGSAGRGVRVSYPELPYIGFWHMPKTDAPYVCIEPWSSLPGRDGVTEDLNCRSDLFRLPVGKTMENTWTVTVL